MILMVRVLFKFGVWIISWMDTVSTPQQIEDKGVMRSKCNEHRPPKIITRSNFGGWGWEGSSEVLSLKKKNIC